MRPQLDLKTQLIKFLPSSEGQRIQEVDLMKILGVIDQLTALKLFFTDTDQEFIARLQQAVGTAKEAAKTIFDNPVGVDHSAQWDLIECIGAELFTFLKLNKKDFNHRENFFDLWKNRLRDTSVDPKYVRKFVQSQFDEVISKDKSQGLKFFQDLGQCFAGSTMQKQPSQLEGCITKITELKNGASNKVVLVVIDYDKTAEELAASINNIVCKCRALRKSKPDNLGEIWFRAVTNASTIKQGYSLFGKKTPAATKENIGIILSDVLTELGFFPVVCKLTERFEDIPGGWETTRWIEKGKLAERIASTLNANVLLLDDFRLTDDPGNKTIRVKKDITSQQLVNLPAELTHKWLCASALRASSKATPRLPPPS